MVSCKQSKFLNYPIWALALEREMGPHVDRERLCPRWDSNPRPSDFDHCCSALFGKRRCLQNFSEKERWLQMSYLIGWFNLLSFINQSESLRYTCTFYWKWTFIHKTQLIPQWKYLLHLRWLRSKTMSKRWYLQRNQPLRMPISLFRSSVSEKKTGN